ncbi:DUF1749-domain-containing protein [Xylona heveae TC161]|uniref:DUF1749-domain-containing protein n=1 Tax=Xylona heveae (strain CBS 132557 / TC161) TaxID=1328760 RepID=A0A165A096_XYLHT|nr:DUF1749-domain-containing protein [Xylona heveae TC161]KZF19766.1 DUF1749-domain-containing protein [Xylona heveae TC161]
MGFIAGPHPGILHHYSPRLVAFEHSPPASHASAPESQPKNTIIFIAGLGDGLLTVPYATKLSQALPPNYRLAEILLFSSYTGWGISSLQRDAAQISECVAYFKRARPGGKIILMGHSTGCQDTIEYLVGRNAASYTPIDGAILQASISDREAIEAELKPATLKRGIEIAQKWVAEGKGDDVLPAEATDGSFGSPCTARRWLSLTSPDHDGDDDYFSSDLSDEQLRQTFGKIPASSPLCILYSGSDQFVPDFVDKAALVKKWIGFVKEGGGKVDEEHSGLVKDASHNLIGNDEPVVKDLIERVLGFVTKIA